MTESAFGGVYHQSARPKKQESGGRGHGGDGRRADSPHHSEARGFPPAILDLALAVNQRDTAHTLIARGQLPTCKCIALDTLLL